jgi:hypothetical protein
VDVASFRFLGCKALKLAQRQAVGNVSAVTLFALRVLAWKGHSTVSAVISSCVFCASLPHLGRLADCYAVCHALVSSTRGRTTFGSLQIKLPLFRCCVTIECRLDLVFKAVTHTACMFSVSCCFVGYIVRFDQIFR